MVQIVSEVQRGDVINLALVRHSTVGKGRRNIDRNMTVSSRITIIIYYTDK